MNPETQAVLDLVGEYATAFNEGKIPLEFAMQSLEDVAFHVDYQARIVWHMKGNKVVDMEFDFQHQMPGVTVIERD
jgi:hypothetical protein